MEVIRIINIIIFFVLIIRGIIYSIKNRKSFIKIIQIQVNKRTFFIFSLSVLIGGAVMFMIFLINKNLGYLKVDSTRDLILSIKQLPEDFIIAFGEEFLLRVLIFLAFLNFSNKKIFALIGSSIIFGFLHNPVDLISTLSYLLAGLMYGTIFLSFKTIWAPIGLHLSWNYFQGAIFGFPVSSQLSEGYFILNIENSSIWNGGQGGPEVSILGIVSRIMIIGFVILLSHYLKNNESTQFLKIETTSGNKV